MNKLFTSVCIFALTVGFVACSDDSSSTSAENQESATQENSIKFEKDVLWLPSYGKRVRTFFNDALTEENFATFDSLSHDGWWWTHVDAQDEPDGKSTVEFTYTDTAMIVDFNLSYDWVEYVPSEDEYWPNRNFVPKIDPYATIGFVFSPDEKPVDISGWKGICLIYESNSSFQMFPAAEGQWYWRVNVPKSEGNKSVFQLDFNELELLSWAPASTPSLEEVLKSSMYFQLEVNHSQMGLSSCYSASPENSCGHMDVKNTIRIYKIGLYGKCGE